MSEPSRCGYCGQTEGHSARCAVTRLGAAEIRVLGGEHRTSEADHRWTCYHDPRCASSEAHDRLSYERAAGPPWLADLCSALGWQGGTIHDALTEVRLMREHYRAPRTAEPVQDVRDLNGPCDLCGLGAPALMMVEGRRVPRHGTCEAAVDRDRAKRTETAVRGACGDVITDRDDEHRTSECLLVAGHPESHFDPRTESHWTDEKHYPGAPAVDVKSEESQEKTR